MKVDDLLCGSEIYIKDKKLLDKLREANASWNWFDILNRHIANLESKVEEARSVAHAMGYYIDNIADFDSSPLIDEAANAMKTAEEDFEWFGKRRHKRYYPKD